MREKVLILILISACFVTGCKKIVPGFLSDTLGYSNREIACIRGLIYQISPKINFDGSTPPVSFKMVNFRDSLTGGAVPAEFETQYDIIQFKPGQTFNLETDTTVELLNAKRETVKVFPYSFNTVSGQFVFNKASANLPLGMYVFDIEATNVNGTKLYPSAGYIKVIDPVQDDLFESFYIANNASNDADGSFTLIKPPVLSFSKVSNEGARVIYKIVDKNGVPFNPKNGEIIRRGDRPDFTTYAKFNPVQQTDTALVCDFEVAPFPLQAYIDAAGTDWGFLQYYRIPSNFIIIDGLPATTGFAANPTVSFQLKLEGTYVVQLQLPDCTRKN